MKSKLLKLSILLLISFTVLITCALLLFVYLLHYHSEDSRTINIAGKQRMLSQRIVKSCILLTYPVTDSVFRGNITNDIYADIIEIKANQQFLLNLDNQAEMRIMLEKAGSLLSKLMVSTIKFSRNPELITYSDLQILLDNENKLLALMMDIVDRYEQISNQKLERFKYFIIFTNIAIMLILLSIVAFIINPAIIENEKSLAIISKNNQELNNLNETRNKLFSIIAHDLRNPFNCICGLSELLVSNLSDKKMEDIETILQKIKGQAENTYYLLENLLDWSRTQTGQIEFYPESIILSKSMEEAVLCLQPIADAKNIKLEIALTENMSITADKAMMNTILRNLITNAIKYSYPGSVVKISASSNANHALIEVMDSGIGMNEMEVGNLFKLDKSLSKNGTAKEKGSGLGLVLCKEFVQRHGGIISISSEPEKGTAIRFTIPNQPS